MKTIKLIIFKLMLLFLTTTLFTNCESDTALETQDELIAVAKQAPFSSSMVYTSEIENNALISEKLRGLTQNRNQSSIENDNNDFSVETNVAKYVEKNDGSGYSYTFAISRENEVGTALENLVLSVNNNTQELSTVLMKYHYTGEQLQEFLNTGHVSTYTEMTVTPIEGDFSDLLTENSLPCSISTTTYHITPDTGDTFIYGEHSTCQHQDGAGNTECEVYTVTTVWCPPTSPGGAGTSTTTTSNPNDPITTNTTGGTTPSTNTNNPNEPSDEIVTTPLTKQEAQEISDQLDNTFGDGNWDYDESVPDEAPNFESLEELQEYLDQIVSENAVLESSNEVLGQDSVREDVYSIKINNTPTAYVKAIIRVQTPSATNGLTRMKVLSMDTVLDDTYIIFDWLQISDTDSDSATGPYSDYYTDSSGNNKLEVSVRGQLILGFKFFGYPVGATNSMKMILNYFLDDINQIDPQYSRWEYL
ncbi:hypothetical protein [Kordia jejudonensis]|uniref:hypothetical protein n=1 Tax=Kordia jejudonensis TaxID=1348245 RepID=UPI0006295F6F|nr:hypothetical protein [Kordia jejudonensis]